MAAQGVATWTSGGCNMSTQKP
ncbi:uncharacterized protein G2W53_026665 [Senna tora]|uniref:Uncharacterized protein n=1 Tax=Senna tora TaxID=362788 RepID=A0A834WFA5_9FABA|nr:uncharacterized protein G2W53_026665 [Senna tora]